MFSKSVTCIFIFLTVCFDEWKFLIFIKFNLSFSVYLLISVSCLKFLCLLQDHKYILPGFFSRSLTVLAFMFMYMIKIELICCVRCVIEVKAHFVSCGYLVVTALIGKQNFFSYWIVLAPLWSIKWICMCGSIFFHCSFCLYLY